MLLKHKIEVQCNCNELYEEADDNFQVIPTDKTIPATFDRIDEL